MPEYIIVKSDNLTDLMEAVTDFMKLGFVPQGGAVLDSHDNQYMQTLARQCFTWGYISGGNNLKPPYIISVATSGSSA